MKELWLMIGIAGSGKSTYAKNLFRQDIIVSRDIIRNKILPEETSELNLFTKEKEVYNEFVNTIKNKLRTGDCAVADATHLTRKARIRLLKHIGKSNYDVCNVIFMNVGLKEALTRNSNRTRRAHVPDSVIASMYSCLELPRKEEGFNQIWAVNACGNIEIGCDTII